LKRLGYKHLEQVQDFTPTPMTLDSAIYYSGIDPYTGKPAYVARDPEEKLRQRAYFFDARMHGPAWKRPLRYAVAAGPRRSTLPLRP
jgi:radical SAM superfamily enzyme YgiQ (UPF0313 family)